MEDNHYQVDKFEVALQQQQRASEALVLIEARSEAAPVAFLRDNYSNKKIRERSKEMDFKMLLSLALTKICGYAGIKSEVSDFDAGDISRMILSAYNDLTLEEIYKAFELERYGVYEDKTEHFQLFNAEYVAAVLKKYKTWRQNTKIQHNISPPAQLPQSTDSDKEEILIKGIIRVFEEYKTTGVMPEPNNYIFDSLYERKLIKDAETEAEKEFYHKMYSKAVAEVKSEMQSKGATFNPVEKRTVKEELQKIIDGNSNKVIARTKKLILANYFDSLIEKNTDIKTLLP